MFVYNKMFLLLPIANDQMVNANLQICSELIKCAISV